jgi:dolichyl-phosphate-mannose-protein mannosyltransferase
MLTIGLRGPGDRIRAVVTFLCTSILAALMISYLSDVWVGRSDLIWANWGLPLLGFLYLAGYFWGWGSLLCSVRCLRPGPERAPALLLLGLGLCAASLSILLIGLAGFLRLSVFIPLSLVVMGFGFRLQPPWKRRIWGAAAGFTLAEATMLGLLAAMFLVAGIDSLRPDTSWDGLAYHLAMDKIYLQRGRIEYIPWMLHTNFPICTDLIFLHGLLVGGDALALPLNLILCAVATGATFKIARLYVERSQALVAALAFVVFPDVANWINTSYVEIGWTAFATMSLWCILEWHHRNERPNSWIHLSAIFAGLAAGTKLPGVFTGAAAGTIALLSSFERRRPLRSLGPAVRFALLFLAVMSPCYLKAYVYTGTPVWPFSFGFFHVNNWNQQIHDRLTSVVQSRWGSKPLTWTNVVWEAWSDQSFLFLHLLSLFVLGSLLRWRMFRKVWPLLVFAGLHYLLIWCMLTRQSRFMLPALPAILVGLVLLTRQESDRLAGRVPFAAFWMAIVLLCLPSWLAKATTTRDTFGSVVQGLKERKDLLADDPLYQVCRMTDDAVPPKAKILLFQEIRGYFLDHDYMWGDPVNQAMVFYPELADGEALRQRLKELGVTHLLLGLGLDRNFAIDPYSLSLVRSLIQVSKQLFINQNYALYDLTQPSPDLVRPIEIFASSTFSDKFPPGGVVDGIQGDEAWGKGGGWNSAGKPTPEHPEDLILVYLKPRPVHKITLYSHPEPRFSLKSFVFQSDPGNGVWTEIPGTRVEDGREATEWTFEFCDLMVQRLHLVITGANDNRFARVLEIAVE